jgi:hypothetical protein
VAAAEVIGTLLLGGLLGTVGQGARTVIGLKKLSDENAGKDPNQMDVFVASRLLISLFLGFIAGVIAALSLGLEKLANVGSGDISLLLGIAAAGYAGTDFIEAFIARTPTFSGKPAGGGGQSEGEDSGGSPEETPKLSPPLETPRTPGLDEAMGAIRAQAENLGKELGSLSSLLATSNTKLSEAVSFVPDDDVQSPTVQDGLHLVTPALVKQIFVPATPDANIRKHLPSVISGLRAKGLVERKMLLMALATIRAETEGFLPISEFVSKFNTDKTPFDKYDKGTPKGQELGNTQVGDGRRYRGRGFVQLTGRSNYQTIGDQLKIDLANNPDLANDSSIAGLILAQFLGNHKVSIQEALAKGDLTTARRLVNGGSHGIKRFIDAFEKGDEIIPEF